MFAQEEISSAKDYVTDVTDIRMNEENLRAVSFSPKNSNDEEMGGEGDGEKGSIRDDSKAQKLITLLKRAWMAISPSPPLPLSPSTENETALRKSRFSAIKNILSVGRGCYHTKRLLCFNGLLNNCFESRMLNCKLPEPDRALPCLYTLSSAIFQQRYYLNIPKLLTCELQ
ncbi:hypothetical protein QUB47_12890 [Microcoleus sp. AT9_B5]